jgi:hypothetical protein
MDFIPTEYDKLDVYSRRLRSGRHEEPNNKGMSVTE